MKRKFLLTLFTIASLTLLVTDVAEGAASCTPVKQSVSVVLSSPGNCIFPTRRKNGRIAGYTETEANVTPPSGNVCGLSGISITPDGSSSFRYDDSFVIALNRAILVGSHDSSVLPFPNSGSLDIWDSFSTIDQRNKTTKGPNNGNPNRVEDPPVCAGGFIGSHSIRREFNPCYLPTSEIPSSGFAYEIPDDVAKELGQYLEGADEYNVTLYAIGDDHITKDCSVTPIRIEISFEVLPDGCSCNFSSPVDISTLDGPVYSKDYIKQGPEVFYSQFDIKRKNGGKQIFSFDGFTYLSNALVINESANILQEPSSINAQLNNYLNSNPLNRQVPSLYNYYLNRASTKKSTSGVSNLTYQSASEVVKQISGDGIVGTPLQDSTPSQNSGDEAVLYANLSLPTSLQELDVSISNSRCAEDAVHFINGDLHIAPPFFASDVSNEAIESYCVFIVKGNLYIEPGLAATADATNYDIIEAYFVVDGSTYIAPDGSDSIYIRGGLVSKNISEIDSDGSPINGTSGLRRVKATGFTPTHLIEYDPSFTFTHVGLLGARQYSIREL